MSYLGDTNVLIRNFTAQNPNDEQSVKQHEEAKRAIQELRERQEKIYYSSEVLKEVKDVAEKPISKNGFGLSPEQSKEIIEKIKNQFDRLPEEKEKIDKRAKELEKYYQEKGTPLTKKEKKDLPHAAVMKEYEVKNILTSNTEDFKKYDHFTTWKPSDVILDLQLDKVEKPQQLNQIKNIYPDRESYEVKLKSGQSAKVHIKGLEKAEIHTKETQVLYSKEVIEKIERGEKDIKAEVKNPVKPTPNNNEQERGEKYIVEVGGEKFNVEIKGNNPDKTIQELSKNPKFLENLKNLDKEKTVELEVNNQKVDQQQNQKF